MNRGLGIALLIIVIGGGCLAQSPSCAGTSGTPLQAAMTASGVSANNFPTSLAMSATITDYSGGTSTSYPAAFMYLNGDNYRWDYSSPDGSASTLVLTGGTAQSQTASGITTVTLSDVVDQTFLTLPLLAFAEWSQTSSYDCNDLGIATIEGQTLDQVSISTSPAMPVAATSATPQSGASYQLDVDPNSSLPTEIDYSWTPANSGGPQQHPPRIPVVLKYSNYHNVSGFMVPYTISWTIAQQWIRTIQVQSVQFDTNISLSQFSLE